MHFEILVEDISGKKVLDNVVPGIIGDSHTFRVIPYKGIGRPPRDLSSSSDPKKRILLNQLPRILQGYGNAFSQYPVGYKAVLMIVVDLDDRCLKISRQELLSVLLSVNPKPDTRFCFAIEEGEAWLLGDRKAVLAAYPKADQGVLNRYTNDSICGTWEVLADILHKDGSAKLIKGGYRKVGEAKSKWAEDISPFMDVNNNNSPSFNYFRSNILELVESSG